jgi:hypothetical protein
MEDPGDRPIFDPGDLIESPDGDLTVRIIEHIGEGRCCMVYSAKTIRDDTKVALKVYKRGPTYDGAVQREQYILELFHEAKHNIGEFELGNKTHSVTPKFWPAFILLILLTFFFDFSDSLWPVHFQGFTLSSHGIAGMQHSLRDLSQRKARIVTMGNAKVCS